MVDLYTETWGDRKRFSVGRLVLEAFVGPCPAGLQCCHANDDPWDNRLENLRWDTPKANAKDRARNGKDVIGEDHAHAVLTRDAVLVARLAADNGFGIKQLSRAFRVNASTIQKAISGDTWSHLGPGGAGALGETE